MGLPPPFCLRGKLKIGISEIAWIAAQRQSRGASAKGRVVLVFTLWEAVDNSWSRRVRLKNYMRFHVDSAYLTSRWYKGDEPSCRSPIRADGGRSVRGKANLVEPPEFDE